MKKEKRTRKILLYSVLGILAAGFMLGTFFFCWFAYRVVDSLFFTPMCSERYYEIPAYAKTYANDVVTAEEINSGEYCTSIESLDDQHRTTCSSEWIDEGAEIAYVNVYLKVDCTANNQTGPDRYFEGIIARGSVVPVARYEEAIAYPKRSGRYIEQLNLTEDEIILIDGYLESLEEKK